MNFFRDAFGVELSKSWTQAPFDFDPELGVFSVNPDSYFNLPAFVVVTLLTVLLVVGVKESARVNAIVVSIKLVVLTIFCIAGAIYVNPENFKPFIPPNEGSFSRFGFTGVLAGASVVFFAFIGFDAISTAAQEARNPQKDLPLAIMSSFSIVTVYYVAVW